MNFLTLYISVEGGVYRNSVKETMKDIKNSANQLCIYNEARYTIYRCTEYSAPGSIDISQA